MHKEMENEEAEELQLAEENFEVIKCQLNKVKKNNNKIFHFRLVSNN